MTQRLDDRIDRFQPAVLSVFRIFFGLLFLFEGLSKVFNWPASYSVPTGSWPVWYAGILELILGTLLTVGLFTRIAAFIAAGEMAVAYFTQHFGRTRKAHPAAASGPSSTAVNWPSRCASDSCCWSSPAAAPMR